MAAATVTAGLQFGEDPQVDSSVLSVLPDVSRVLDVKYHGESVWAKAIRIDVEQNDGSEKSYFMKVSVGHHGREALKGEFEGTSAIYNAVPGFSPRPLAWGTFASQPDSHFYVCDFYEFVAGALPEPTSFCKSLARLHQAPQNSTDRKFGFHCTTYNGDLPQDNTWFDKWEDFFANSLRHVLRVREERAGPNDELDSLLPTLFEKVIPRLLRPLETGGRTVAPSLVHGDLWCGNAAVVEETDESIVFDPAAFWGHNEYELGNWRPARNKFTARYFREYQSHIPKSQPEEDFDDRNLLYSMRFNLNASALFPNQEQFLQMVIDDIKLLNEKFKDGYQGE